MEFIKFFSPVSNFPTINNFESQKEFSKLTLGHKAITLLATGILTLLSIGFATSSYFHTLVGRFRKVELDQEASQKNVTAAKTDAVGKTIGDCESIETKFWEDLHSNEELHQMLQIFVNSGEDNIAEAVVDNYLTFQKDKNIAQHKELLIQSVNVQLEKNEHFHEDPPRQPGENIRRRLPGNAGTLITYETAGDGACGLHAILGTAGPNGVYRTNAAEKRVEFCNYLKGLHQIGFVPERIQNVLTDYFLHFDQQPRHFKEFFQTVQLEIDTYKARHASLAGDNDAQDRIVENFMHDPQIFDVYLANLKKVETYLLQDELIVAAECFQKNIDLYQPGWGVDRNKVNHILIPCPGATESVAVWYNGSGHYERAAILK